MTVALFYWLVFRYLAGGRTVRCLPDRCRLTRAKLYSTILLGARLTRVNVTRAVGADFTGAILE